MHLTVIFAWLDLELTKFWQNLKTFRNANFRIQTI